MRAEYAAFAGLLSSAWPGNKPLEKAASFGTYKRTIILLFFKNNFLEAYGKLLTGESYNTKQTASTLPVNYFSKHIHRISHLRLRSGLRASEPSAGAPAIR